MKINIYNTDNIYKFDLYDISSNIHIEYALDIG